MKILVTGANGLLGQKLCDLINSTTEHKLVATGRGNSRIGELKAGNIYRTLDTTDKGAVEGLIAVEKPDVVINTAGKTHVDECELDPSDCHLQNVVATENLAKACEANNVHFIHLSTDFIFDGEAGPYDENGTPNPISVYGHCKLKGEEVTKAILTPYAILRTVLVYGITPKMSRTNIVLWVKNSLESGKQIKVVNDQWRTPTLAEDLAIGCLLAAEKKATGIYNISGEQMLTPYDMAIATAEYFGLDKSLIEVANAANFSQPAKRPPKTGFVIEKAKQDLGYKPRTFMEGLAILKSQLHLLN